MPGNGLEYASEGGAQDLRERLVRVWISLCGVAIVTFVAYRVIPLNLTTAGFAYLLLVLVIASTWGFLEAPVSSILAALAFDYFFVPPILGFRPTKSEDWIALFRFAATSLIASHMSTTVKRRTSEVIRAEEALRQAQSDLAHISRITTLGELTASLAHEVNQPIAAANRCLRWLTRDHPDVEEAREAATRMAKDTNRAADVIGRIRLLFKKGTPHHELVDVNEVIREIIVPLRGEATRYSVSVRTELASDAPRVMGDPVQFQQVFMNLTLNGIDTIKHMEAGGELTIKSQTQSGQLLISVSDIGVGLPRKQADRIFNAFFTTKLHGTGMGLSISRSIVESHGGRLWAADNTPRGAIFQLSLPTKDEAHE
jgi:C4-dicarboxylate-specific signal transduction histidine kinase